MSRLLLVDAAHPEETRVVLTDANSRILEFDFTTASKPQIKGNVYLAKITRVEPSLQAAFVEYGGGKQGFLPFSEIHPSYYQIPQADRDKLLAEEEELAQQDQDDDDDEIDAADEMAGESEEDHDGETGDASQEDDTESTTSPNRSNELTEADLPPAAIAAGNEANHDETISAEAPDEGDDETTESGDEEAESSEGSEDDQSQRRRRGGNNRRRFRGRSRDGRGGKGNRRSSGGSDLEESGVETLGNDEEAERPKKNIRNFHRRYKIQEVIKRNQVLLVQVVKEERGNKGVSLTSYLSLAGRYCVLMPNSPRGGGISRKITDGQDRKRLKDTIAELELPTGMNVIIRTAGSGRTRVEIRRDYDYLVKLWNDIREQTLSSTAPALVYEESNIVQRTIRDCYSNDIEKVVVEGEDAYKDTKAFMKMLIPSHAAKVKHHKSDTPLFHEYGVESQIQSMTEPEVRLRSGGSIVMTPTEALISIDVNSGRSTRERNVEETATKTNIEAAKEIAKQLRLRDLAGLIVIDFIDMMDGRNRRQVERTLKDALKNDRAKIQLSRISPFGLLEMSRQRLRPSISESINNTCPHCQGSGIVRSKASTGIQIIRAIEKDAGGKFSHFTVKATISAAMHLLNHMRGEIAEIESRYDCKIEVEVDPTLNEGDFEVQKKRGAHDKEANERKPSRHDRSGKNTKDSSDTEAEEDRSEEASPRDEDENADEKREKRRSSRGRRGGRRNRNRKSEDNENADSNDAKSTENDGKQDNTPEADAPVKEAKPPKSEPAMPAEDEPKKPTRTRRTRKPSAAKEAETAEPSSPAPKAVKEPKAAAKKPDGPKRKGWWQKIID